MTKTAVTKAAAKPAPKASPKTEPAAAPADMSVDQAEKTVEPSEIVAMAERMRSPKAADALMFGYTFSHGAPKAKHLNSFDKVFNGVIELGHAEWPV